MVNQFVKYGVRLVFFAALLLLAAGCATPGAAGPTALEGAAAQSPALAPVVASPVPATDAAVSPPAIMAASDAAGGTTGVAVTPDLAVTTGGVATPDAVATQVAAGIAATLAAQGQIDAAVAATLNAQAAALPPTASPLPPTATATLTPLPSATPCVLELTAGLNAFVRTGPGTNFDALGVLQAGERTAIVGQWADWWVVTFGGHQGWISASVVTLNDCPTAPVPPPVVPPPSPTPTALPTAIPTATPIRVSVINLLDLAPRGVWVTGELLADGHNTRRTTAIPFGGEGATGAVRAKTHVLEDGTSRYVLDTHPMWVDYGAIKGRLPWVLLPPSTALFEAEVGFISGAGNTDGVTFWVWEHHYENGREVWNPVARVRKTYDGRLLPLRVDLSHLAGQSVSIELRVDAGASSGQDWAAWVAPRITGH